MDGVLNDGSDSDPNDSHECNNEMNKESNDVVVVCCSNNDRSTRNLSMDLVSINSDGNASS